MQKIGKVGKEGCGRRYFCKPCEFKTDDYYEAQKHVCEKDGVVRQEALDTCCDKKLR